MIDPELAAMIDLLPKIDLLDPVAARQAFADILAAIKIDIPGIETLDIEDRMVPGFEGDPDVSVRVYRPKPKRAGEAAPTLAPGVVMIHGGGFVIGSVETEHGGVAAMAIDSGAVVVSVDYRLAPEHPYPAGLHDCYAALSYLHAEADALGVDPARVALAGASAGGGLAAATALLARDHGGPAVCFQLLQIPELDDRLETGSCRRSWTRPCGIVLWPSRAGRRISVRSTAPAPPTCRTTRPRPGRPISPACRRRTSRRPRTTRYATRGSRTPCVCCRRASRSSCTSSPAPSTARRW